MLLKLVWIIVLLQINFSNELECKTADAGMIKEINCTFRMLNL